MRVSRGGEPVAFGRKTHSIHLTSPKTVCQATPCIPARVSFGLECERECESRLVPKAVHLGLSHYASLSGTCRLGRSLPRFLVLSWHLSGLAFLIKDPAVT